MESSKENNILIGKAYEAMEYAYSPYSRFKVGAAVEAFGKSGEKRIFTGCNIENATYGATICAERTAVCKAVSEGFDNISSIAIVSSGGDFTYPCGICRQILAEFSNKDTKVILHSKITGSIKIYGVSELLPEAFKFNK